MRAAGSGGGGEGALRECNSDASAAAGSWLAAAACPGSKAGRPAGNWAEAKAAEILDGGWGVFERIYWRAMAAGAQGQA